MVHPRHIQPVEQQVGDAQHIGELLFFDAIDGIPVLFGVGGALHLLLQLLQPADEKTAGAAGKVGHLLSDLGADHLGHKVRDGPGRVEFTGRTGTLQFFQNGLIDLAEGMTLLIVTKVQVVNHIKDLSQQHAILHVLVGVGKHGLNNGLSNGRARVYLNTFDQDLAVGVLDVLPLQHREQRVVYKFQQLVPSHGTAGLVVMGPVCPAARFRNDRLIIVFVPLPVLFLGVVYFQKQHPGDLFNALGITVDACIIAHNIPQPLYKSGQITHCGFPSLSSISLKHILRSFLCEFPFLGDTVYGTTASCMGSPLMIFIQNCLAAPSSRSVHHFCNLGRGCQIHTRHFVFRCSLKLH